MNLKEHRVLAYKKAREIKKEALEQVGGGEGNDPSLFTTKQTFSTSGSWDIVADVQW